MTADLHELPRRWRYYAEGVRTVSASVADAYARAAEELERELSAQAEDLLTLAQAARETGFTADHLGRLLRQKKLANHGRAGAPRIRRGDLPSRRRGIAP